MSSQQDSTPSRSTADARTPGEEETLVGDGGSASGAHVLQVEPGSTVGRYVVLERIGAGAMGVVFAAYDPELDRKVALKILEPRRMDDTVDSTQVRTRLIREAQTLAKLSHPHVLGIFDAGVVDEDGASPRVFLATEFLEGEDLADWVRGEQRSSRFARGRSWRAIVERFVQAGRGLAAAHRAGIVHRDFKPHNVRVGKDGRVRVLDFGLARRHDEAPREAAQESRLPEQGVDPDGVSTPWGTLSGTPAYMSPEQLSGSAVGPASDQFSFCVALYEALYAARPFSADNVGALLHQTTREKIRPLEATRGVPRRIHRALLRGLRADPDARHPSMDALLEALARDPWVEIRKAFLFLSACGFVALLAWSAWAYTRPGLVHVSVATDHGEAEHEVWVGEHRLEFTAGGARGEVSAGLHRLRVTAPNYQPFEGVLEVRRDGVHEVAITLEHERGTLDLVVEPHDATIRLSGVDYGSRLVELPLPTGEHRIAITREGSYETERTYTIRADDRLRDFVYLPDAVAWSTHESGYNLDVRFIGDVTGDGLPEILHRNFNTITVSDPWNDQPLWRGDLGAQQFELIGLGDVTGDGKTDVVATWTSMGLQSLEVWAAAGSPDKTPAVVWSDRPARQDASSVQLLQRPLILDVDGTPLVVVGGLWAASTLTIYDGRTGGRVQDRDLGSPIVGLAPLVRNGETALVVVTTDRIELHSLPNLRVLWSIEGSIEDPDQAIAAHLRLAAVKNPAPWPPVIASSEHDGIVLVPETGASHGESKLRALSGRDGVLLWTRPDLPFDTAIVPSPAGDGAPRFLATTTAPRQAHVIEATSGRTVFTVSDASGSWLQWPDAPTAFLAVRSKTSLEVLDPETGAHELAIEVPEGSASDPVIADWDGDGQPELLVADRTQSIRVYDRRGAHQGSIRLTANAYWIRAVGDVDGDGFEDLIASANGPVVLVGPKVRWSRRSGDAVRAAPVAADLRGDGTVLVAAFGSFTGTEALYLLDGRTGRVEAVSERAEAIRAPVLVPRHDGGADLLGQVMNGTMTTLFSGRDASTLRSFVFRQAYGTPGLGDLEGDGRLEVVPVGWTEGQFPVLDLETFEPRWSHAAASGSWSTPWIGDLDGDGRNELLMGFHDGSLALYRGRTRDPVWSVDMGSAKHDNTPWLVDLDADGTLEILVSRTSAPWDLLVLDGASGRELRRFEGMATPSARVVTGDADGDGGLDLFVAPTDGTLRRIDLTDAGGWSVEILPGPWGAPDLAMGRLELADLDGDGRSELLVATSNGRLLVFDAAEGTLRWRFRTGDKVEGGPTVVDVDGDGVLEVLLGSADRRLYCLRTPLARH